MPRLCLDLEKLISVLGWVWDLKQIGYNIILKAFSSRQMLCDRSQNNTHGLSILE